VEFVPFLCLRKSRSEGGVFHKDAFLVRSRFNYEEFGSVHSHVTPITRTLEVAIIVKSDPVPAVTEKDATGSTARIFSEIRETLNVDVVNLVWRHLATMPGALEWVWDSLKPLYRGPAIAAAESIRANLTLLKISHLSNDVLTAAGINDSALSSIRGILDSYQHTNALALVCFSGLLTRFEEPKPSHIAIRSAERDAIASSTAPRAALPRLIPVSEMAPAVARLVRELNEFGEDSETDLLASMYRHLSHWPPYLALVRTLLFPLHESGELRGIVARTRLLGENLGKQLALNIFTDHPPFDVTLALVAVRRFAHHPIARMTAICSLIRSATPE
jgi:hypothetical protein